MANAPTNAPTLDQLIALISPIVQKHGVQSFAFLAIDPKTKAQMFYGSPNAKAELRTLAGMKFGLGDQAETGWEG